MYMTDNELAQELQRLANSAPYGEKMTYIELFGIKYAHLLNRDNCQRIVEMAQIGKLGPTVNMGRRLAEYVTLNDPNWPN